MTGEFRLRITTAMPERLLRRAMDSGAEFAGVRRADAHTLIVDCDEESAARMIALCERYRIDCRILNSGGRTALREKLRHRITLLAGFALCALICAVFFGRLWRIDVVFTGPAAELGREEKILEFLQDMNVSIAMPSGKLDTDYLQKQLMAQAGDYSHIGVRLQGVRLLIEAVPEEPAPEVYDISGARDLISAMDGVVSHINVKSGRACVQVGDTVRRGQILISGEEEKSAEETVPVSALGEVYVRSWFEGSAEGDLIEERRTRTGRSSVSSGLKLMDVTIPLTEGKGFLQSETETRIVPIVGMYLPVEILRSTHYEVETVSAQADADALKARLCILAQSEARSKLSKEMLSAYEITDYWEEFSIESNVLRLRAVYEVTADVAVTRDTLTEEVYQSWKAADK